MKPMSSADEKRSPDKVETGKSAKLLAGNAKDSLQKAQDLEDRAHSRKWRDSSLRAPD